MLFRNNTMNVKKDKFDQMIKDCYKAPINHKKTLYYGDPHLDDPTDDRRHCFIVPKSEGKRSTTAFLITFDDEKIWLETCGARETMHEWELREALRMFGDYLIKLSDNGYLNIEIKHKGRKDKYREGER